MIRSGMDDHLKIWQAKNIRFTCCQNINLWLDSADTLDNRKTKIFIGQKPDALGIHDVEAALRARVTAKRRSSSA